MIYPWKYYLTQETADSAGKAKQQRFNKNKSLAGAISSKRYYSHLRSAPTHMSSRGRGAHKNKRYRPESAIISLLEDYSEWN